MFNEIQFESQNYEKQEAYISSLNNQAILWLSFHDSEIEAGLFCAIESHGTRFGRSMFREVPNEFGIEECKIRRVISLTERLHKIYM